jgi:hypothetical protein
MSQLKAFEKDLTPELLKHLEQESLDTLLPLILRAAKKYMSAPSSAPAPHVDAPVKVKKAPTGNALYYQWFCAVKRRDDGKPREGDEELLEKYSEQVTIPEEKPEKSTIDWDALAPLHGKSFETVKEFIDFCAENVQVKRKGKDELVPLDNAMSLSSIHMRGQIA